MWYIWLIIGMVSGSLITCGLISLRTIYGYFRVDRSNPEKDIYRLDIKDLDAVSKKKRIVLKVDNNADLSQK